MPRHYYAIHHPYGARTISAGDRLKRYQSAEAREHDAERLTDRDGVSRLEPVTRDEARELFPSAFRPSTRDRWTRWQRYDTADEWPEHATGRSYKYL